MAYLDESNLPASDVARIGGFYPREIILDTTTDKMVYVKLVKSICAMAIMPDSTLQLVSVWNILDKYIPSENWGFIVGRSTLLTILPNSLVEYSRFGNSMLKTIKLDTSVLPFSFRYDPYTDSVFLSTLDLIITLKLNVAQIDTYYYTINRA